MQKSTGVVVEFSDGGVEAWATRERRGVTENVSPQDPWYQVSEVLRLIRSGRAQTRPELADDTRLGRNVITQRIQAAQQLGLIEPDGTGRSRGGRAAEVWRFRGAAGLVCVALIGTQRFRAVVAGLDGTVIGRTDVAWPVARGPEATCERIAEELDRLLTDAGLGRPWGVAVGLPAPVDFTTGQSVDPVAPSASAGRWPRDFDVRGWFSRRYQAPAWVDAVSNLMALGASVAPGAPQDLLFVRLGTGLGAGIVSGGRLHRGAAWIAGELNHVKVADDADRLCLCGHIGCLDAYASGWTMLRDADAAVAEGRSPYLADAASRGVLTLDALSEGARLGDVACREIVIRSAESLGAVLAGFAMWFNPAEIVIGGFRIAQDELFLLTVNRTLRLNALAATMASLRVRAGDPDQAEAIAGAVEMVTDALVSAAYLAEWGPVGSPTDALALRERPEQ